MSRVQFMTSMTTRHDRQRVSRAWRVALVVLSLAAPVPAAEAADSAVIIMYHRFGEDDFPTTNIRLEQFEQHLEELQNGGYTVLPVSEILTAIREGRELPDRTVGITIDDAYLTVYTEAWPRLRRAGYPFTLFVATGAIDGGFERYMSWEQIRELRDAGVTIGSQTASHLHMAANSPERNAEDLARSNARFEVELGTVPTLFAYPYGEASTRVQDKVRAAGFGAAFGQHSGVVHVTADHYYLPRFAFNEAYGDIDRFRLVVNALPLPIGDLTPADPTLHVNPPVFGFTVTEEVGSLSGLTCYASDQGQTNLERLGPRFEVRLEQPFGAGRARINCTAPVGDGRWRWFGMQYYVPAETTTR
ncbi:MAG: polysaccharide deacetylase family protein [Alphaproteobacteria bacterium]